MRTTTCACWRRQQGIRVENVFDTLVAAELLNEPEIGLASLLQKVHQGLHVDKKFQKADWSKRPLACGPCSTTPLATRPTSSPCATSWEIRLTGKGAVELGRLEEFALLTDAPFNLQDNQR
jgi:hypothetical protein